MPRYDAPSRCGVLGGASFRWYGYPQCAIGDDLDTALEVLLSAVSKPGRVWSPSAKAMVKAEFKQRLKKAIAGRLKPVDEVTPVDVQNPPPLYEIRWQHIPVTERDEQGVITHAQVLVRMYHSEPIAAPDHFVGHHAHEKLLDVDDINATQQAEIGIAIKWYNQGEGDRWGIAA